MDILARRLTDLALKVDARLDGLTSQIATVAGTGGTSSTAGVASFNGRTGGVTLSSGDVTTALTFTPASEVHAHTISEVTGLQGALDGKQVAGSYAAAAHTHVIADVTGLQGALDAKLAGTYPGGTANFLRADGTWAAPPTGGGGVSDGDKGDIVVSGSGATWALDSGVVTTFARTFLDDIDAPAVRTTLGLGSLATQSGTFSGTSSGTNTGDQFTNLPSSRVIGRVTAGFGASEELTGTQVTTLIDPATTTLKGAMSAADKTKLDGVATGATANSSDATLLARANHTGTQALTTVSFAATARLAGRTTAGAGAAEELTAAQTKTLLAIVAADVGGLSVLATSTDAANLTGTVAATQLPALTGGDVTSPAGSGTLTIGNGAVTLAKMANVAAGTVFYRKTAAAGVPEVQTLATLKTDLGLTGTNSGDQTITLTGDVTGSGTGSFAATIASTVISTFGRTLTDDADAPTARATLGLGTAATKNLHVGTTAPASPAVNDLWLDTN